VGLRPPEPARGVICTRLPARSSSSDDRCALLDLAGIRCPLWVVVAAVASQRRTLDSHRGRGRRAVHSEWRENRMVT
jgi:hypothetical protein